MSGRLLRRPAPGRRELIGSVAAGLVIAILSAVVSPTYFFRGYLIGLLFWLGIALGSLALVMIHFVAGGTWGVIVRRPLEAAALTLPLLLVLFLPLVFGRHNVWYWTNDASGVGAHAQFYLSLPFWLLRVLLYFAVWSVLALLIYRYEDQGAAGARRIARLSPLGLILYVLTACFAAIDWVMSLEPNWASTIFGMITMVGQGVATMSFAIIVVTVLSLWEPLATVLGDKPTRLNDLGNLLLTFVMLWAYVSFSQFLIVWYGNLPRETTWYLHRTEGGWHLVAAALMLVHFALPFGMLLFRAIKRHPRFLASVAGSLLVMHLIDLWWQIVPSYRAGPTLHLPDVLLPVAIGCLWVPAWFVVLRRRPVLPPESAVAHEHVTAPAGATT